MPEMIAHIGVGPSLLARSTDPVSTPPPSRRSLPSTLFCALSNHPERLSDLPVNRVPRGERDVRSNRGTGGGGEEGETRRAYASRSRLRPSAWRLYGRPLFLAHTAREESPRTRAAAIRTSSRRGRVRGGGTRARRRSAGELLAGMSLSRAERDDRFAACQIPVDRCIGVLLIGNSARRRRIFQSPKCPSGVADVLKFKASSGSEKRARLLRAC